MGAQAPLADGNTIPWPGGTNGVITLGLTNQWRFYVLTNDQNYTNAAFLTFQPVNLSLPRLGVNQTNLDNATRAEADIDLYVSTDPGLTNLDAAALAAADKALGRGGTGAIVYSNVAPGAVYYVGVKAEDQEAAQYAFMGVFSLLPFGEQDQNGNWILRGINLPAVIPDGTAARPGVTNVVAIAPAPIPVRRVVVTNEVWHESFADLLGTLSHGRKSAVLNNHSLPPVDPVPYQYTYVYEDNGEGDIPGAQPTDGPGSLRDFIGEQGMGVWLLTMADTVSGHTGLVENLTIRLDPQNVVNGADARRAHQRLLLRLPRCPHRRDEPHRLPLQRLCHAPARGALPPPRQPPHRNQLRPNADGHSPFGMLVRKPLPRCRRSTRAAITSASSTRMESPRPFGLTPAVDLDPSWRRPRHLRLRRANPHPGRRGHQRQPLRVQPPTHRLP